jgi:hypothetical protein
MRSLSAVINISGIDEIDTISTGTLDDSEAIIFACRTSKIHRRHNAPTITPVRPNVLYSIRILLVEWSCGYLIISHPGFPIDLGMEGSVSLARRIVSIRK